MIKDFFIFTKDKEVFYMKIACSTFMIPGETFTEKFRKAREYGFEGMEIRLGDTDTTPEIVKEIITALDDNHLTTYALLIPRNSFRRPLDSLEALKEKKKHAELSLEIAAQIGCPAVLAAEYQCQDPLPLFNHPKRPIQKEIELLTDFLFFSAQYAKKVGSSVLIEPINRYETHFYYSLKDCKEYIDMVGENNIKIMADFFHMSIEENDIAQAIINAGESIGHVQLGDSNRMLPGHGHTDFVSGFSALKAIQYIGGMALECSISGDTEIELPRCVQYLKRMIDNA